jgi:hypothetical protein
MANEAIQRFIQDETEPIKYCDFSPQDTKVPEYVFVLGNGSKAFFCKQHAWEFFLKHPEFQQGLLFEMALARSS